MRGFETPWPVSVTQISTTEWRLDKPIRYHAPARTFEVPTGTETDFASIPRILVWLIPKLTGTAAAVLHDWLWREWARRGLMTYREADGLLRQALGHLGVSFVRRWLMWAAVRWGALTRPGGWRGWWRDAPLVLAISVAALPVLAPALVTVPFIAVFVLVERLVSLLCK